MSNSQATTELQTVRLPSSVLFGWFARFFAVFAMVIVWAGHFFLEGTWPAPLKLWLCTGMGMAAILHSVFRIARRRPGLVSIAPRDVRRVISPAQAVGVVGIVIAAGVFLTWVASAPAR